MKKSLATLLTSALGLALLIYSALRSVDFIGATLPPDKQILAFFALAATEGGLLFWLAYFLFAAAGGYQRAISLVMIVVDLVGSIALFTADTLLRSGESGLTAALGQAQVFSIILAMSAVIALNVGATVFCHIVDPDNRRKRASEEAMDQIEEMAIKQIAENSQRLAAELAPSLAADWMENTRAQYQGALTKRAASRRALAFSKNFEVEALPEMTSPNSNGRGKQPGE